MATSHLLLAGMVSRAGLRLVAQTFSGEAESMLGAPIRSGSEVINSTYTCQREVLRSTLAIDQPSIKLLKSAQPRGYASQTCRPHNALHVASDALQVLGYRDLQGSERQSSSLHRL